MILKLVIDYKKYWIVCSKMMKYDTCRKIKKYLKLKTLFLLIKSNQSNITY